MRGRLVNLDTVARVLAEYYHLKTDTQLAALDEALSRVPAETVGGGHGKDHVGDPGKMVEDLISRRAAIDVLAEWHDEAITNRLNNLPSAQQWIPFKTCKPKKDGDYFVTYRLEFGGEELAVTSDYYHVNTDEWEVTGSVLAWMPLPEPWKGERDG